MSKYVRAIIENVLPEVVRRAGKDTVSVVAERLSRAVSSKGVVSAAAGLQVLDEILDEWTRQRSRSEDRRLMLESAPEGELRTSALTEAIIATAVEAGTRPAADIKALGRWLDAGAVLDRDADALQRREQLLEFTALALAGFIRPDMNIPGVELDTAELQAMGVPERSLRCVTRLLRQTELRWPARVAGCRLLGALALASSEWQQVARQPLLDTAADRYDDPWVQTTALECYVEIRHTLELDVADVLRPILCPKKSLRRFLPPNHIYVRARAARLCVEAGDLELLAEVFGGTEESEHVRLEAVRALAASDDDDAHALLQRITSGDLRDQSRVVRAAAAVESLPAVGRPRTASHWIDRVAGAITTGEEPWIPELVIKVVLERFDAIAADAAQVAAAASVWRSDLAHWREAGRDDLGEQASLLLQRLDVFADERMSRAVSELASWSRTAPEGSSRVFSGGALAELPPDAALEVLGVCAADGFDLSATRLPLRRGYRVYSGMVTRFAAWRAWREMRHLAPDKRQAYFHLTDRAWPGQLIALSSRMSEVTPAKVPGHRVSGTTQLAWGSELPLPSLLLSASRHGVIEVWTAKNRLTIRRKKGAMAARITAHRHYERLVTLREQLRAQPPDAARRKYDETLSQLGFTVERKTASALAAALPFVEDLKHGLFVRDTSTLFDLLAVTAGIGAYIVTTNFIAERMMRRWRSTINLVIGGWGSRGKSGVERLKAALFYGLGYRVCSKTTGCEAMVVIGVPGREAKEIFLFRAYDKASIFEQRDVVRLASHRRAQVFLWECMALNPQYVQILQRDWMRDDLSTVTNTYPDHEDIQGPSGRDVAEVIGCFVPTNARAFTTEVHMTPVLQTAAREKRTPLTLVGWGERSLLPSDVLARFPYAEHPNNIALVCALAASLGIQRDVALRAMAEEVIPDLGVLKEYGPAEAWERKLTFVNGCSANERAGFMSNWIRMGMTEWPENAGLADRLTVVINNRADRLARQRVFADIVARDVSADAVAVIGTNVGPFAQDFYQLVKKRGEEMIRGVSNDPTELKDLVDEMAKRLRRRALPRAEADRIARAFLGDAATGALDKILDEAYEAHTAPVPTEGKPPKDGEDPSDEAYRLRVTRAWVLESAWLWRLRQTVGEWQPAAEVRRCVEILSKRVFPLLNPNLTGDQVLRSVAILSPPGSSTRILGAQNIKGTGLDFVYRWLSIDRVGGWLGAVASGKRAEAGAALRSLAQHSDYGVVDAARVLNEIQAPELRARLRMQGLGMDAERTVEALQRVLAPKQAALERSREVSYRRQALQWVEAVLDGFDSIRRRHQADVLYRDLGYRRISLERAAKVAAALQYRQKGGWMVK